MKELYNTSLLNIEDYESLEECQECEGVNNNGEYIIEELYNGNWTDAVNNLKDLCVSAIEFADFVEELEDELGYKYDFLDRQAFISITQLYCNN